MAEEMGTGRPRRVMVVVAHPDDAEFGAAGTLALWAKEGSEIIYVLCTSGDKGTSDVSIKPAELARRREQEQKAAAAIVGAREVVFLRYEDGVLLNTLQLRRDIVRQIRTYRPDVVVCQDPTSRFRDNYINHPDHRAAGDATLDAVFPSARDPHVFPELLAEGLQPHKVLEVYLMGPASPNTWIDISRTLDLKLAALRQHVSQFDDPEQVMERVRQRAREMADGHGMEYAEAFRYIKIN